MHLDNKAYYRLPTSFNPGDRVYHKVDTNTIYTVTETNPVGVWIEADGKIPMCAPPETLIKINDLAFDSWKGGKIPLN